MKKILRHFFLKTFGTLKSVKKEIHIINSHYVTNKQVNLKANSFVFENYLKELSKYSEFINLDNAVGKILKRDFLDDKVLVAFTFDDGFEECYTIIAPLLEKYNCRGTFFINANYIESNLEYQDDFNKRIAISSKKPMSWNQVIDLHKRGHIIGSHGLDHYNFRELEPNEIENQIKKNKQILEDKLNYNCDYFA